MITEGYELYWQEQNRSNRRKTWPSLILSTNTPTRNERLATNSPSKAVTTLEPELTQHIQSTFVWAYIEMCGYFCSDMSVQSSSYKRTCFSQSAYSRRCGKWYMMYVSDEDCNELLLTAIIICLKYVNRRRRCVYQFWETRTEGKYFKLCKILTKFPDTFREYYRKNTNIFYYILESVKDNLQGLF